MEEIKENYTEATPPTPPQIDIFFVKHHVICDDNYYGYFSDVMCMFPTVEEAKEFINLRIKSNKEKGYEPESPGDEFYTITRMNFYSEKQEELFHITPEARRSNGVDEKKNDT
jgi:hypothetical protein